MRGQSWIWRASSCRRAIRSGIGGCVENSCDMPCALNGLAIISADVVCTSGVGCSGRRAVPCLELGQRGRQRQRVAGEHRAGLVGLVLAGPADRELDEPGGDRAEDRDQQRADGVALAVVAAAAAQERQEVRQLGQEHDHGRQRRSHRRDEDVAVVDVRQLVPEHAAQLALVEQRRMPSVQQTAAFSGLRPVANALGASVGDTYSAGIGWPAAVESSCTTRYMTGCWCESTGYALHRAQRELGAVEVRVAVRGQRDDERDDEPAGPADERAGQQDQGRQGREQDRGLEPVVVAVHEGSLPPEVPDCPASSYPENEGYGTSVPSRAENRLNGRPAGGSAGRSGPEQADHERGAADRTSGHRQRQADRPAGAGRHRRPSRRRRSAARLGSAAGPGSRARPAAIAANRR